MKKVSMIAIFAFLLSCASTPDLNYYTLDMRASRSGDGTVNLEVGRFTVSEKLDRHQIVIQQSPTRLGYYAKDRWAASIGEMVEQKLATEFSGVDPEQRSLIVEGRIVAFEQVDAATGPVARVGVEIVMRDGGAMRYEPPLLEKTYKVERTAESNSVDAVVQALSRAVEEIAAEIATDAAGL